MKRMKKISSLVLVTMLVNLSLRAQNQQWVEGFDKVVFHHDDSDPRRPLNRDFRGQSKGYMTAGWWIPGHMDRNFVSWQTAVVPEKKPTTFSFIGSTSVLPSEISKGPQAKLTVNGQYALTFTLGMMRDYTWTEGDYQLKYISKRVEYPYTSTHREFDLYGNSGVFQLSVPGSAVEAGKPVSLQVEILPFERWHNGWFMVKEYRDVLKTSIESLEGQLEALRMDMAKLNEQTQILATQAYSKMLGTDKYEHSVVYTDGYRHLHPADIIKLKNGEILLMTREGTEHISNDGDVIMLRSKDGGKTWGDKITIAGIKNVDEREGCGIQLKDGTIMVGVFYNNLYDKDGEYAWPTNNPELQKLSESDKRYTEPGKHYLGAYTISSKDNGRTWSKPAYIETANMPFTNLEGPTDAPIEMPDGSVLMAVIGYSPKSDVGNRSSVMLRSTDKGKIWSYLSTIASDPGGKLGGFMEPGIVRTKTGRIVVGLRNHAPENAIWSTYSDDNGKTWAPVWKTDMIGHPADIIQLKDGRLVMSYGIRDGIHGSPGGIRACFSNDNGKTWDIKTEVQLRNDFLNVDVGYPESIQRPDGKVMTLYYYNLFGKYFIGSTVWQP
ncbi:sialidase family protein [Flavisolibacter ginsenosidimutans]|uniref:Exo-alpha-sialidase n=1 Tax=Flavisolibacter ginsenosidimutans TaxID=661481 RepID=A0A5B8UDM3_9BACT|nr:sialidase family protein [Flavisolibacter ginsenosidimutans]QEC54396.1 exo-alpha-sialidase [Flavisolibacter ginsenosidimutans]